MKKQGQRPLEELIHAGLGGWGVFKFRKRKISMAPEHVAKETHKIMTPKVAEKKGPQQRLDIPKPEQSTTVWGKTGILVDRLRKGGKIEDRGGEFYYIPLGKPLIHSDSHILGGIYFGAGGKGKPSS